MWGLAETATANLQAGAPAGLLHLAKNVAAYPASAEIGNVFARTCDIAPAGGLFALLDPACDAQYLEQFRLLRTQLLLHRSRAGDIPFHSVTVMSTDPGEGKSFTASNLACVLAGTSTEDVLLIDANPEGRGFPIGEASEGPGLHAALETPEQWRDSVVRAGATRLCILPRGSSGGRSWNLEPLPRLLALLQNSFDWIVLDGASFRTSPDAPWLASICDTTLLVVQESASSFGAVRDSLERIPAERFAGVVFNHHPPKRKQGFRVKLRIRR